MLKRAYPYSTDETLFLLNGKRENIDSSADSADSERVIRDFGGFRGREGDFDKGRPRFCRFSRTGVILGENVRPSGKPGTPDSEAKDRVLVTQIQ